MIQFTIAQLVQCGVLLLGAGFLVGFFVCDKMNSEAQG